MIFPKLLQSDLFACLGRFIVSGVQSPARSSIQGTSVRPHTIAVTKLLSSNLKVNLMYVSTHQVESGGEEAALTKDAACMYFGNQLNLLYA